MRLTSRLHLSEVTATERFIYSSLADGGPGGALTLSPSNVVLSSGMGESRMVAECEDVGGWSSCATSFNSGSVTLEFWQCGIWREILVHCRHLSGNGDNRWCHHLLAVTVIMLC